MEAHRELADLHAMENPKQAIKNHWNDNKKKLEDLIKEIDSKLDLFDDTVDNQATKNQQESTVFETAWKNVKETHKKIKVIVDQMEEYDVTALDELSEIKIRSNKIMEQADRRSERYRNTNEIFRKCVEKSVNKKNNIKLETMMVPVLDTKLNNYTFGYWEGLVQTYVSTQCINDGAKKQFLLSKLDETAKSLVSSTEKYDDCMNALRRHFGDELRIRNEKIANFVRWSQERPTDIRETEKISKEITYIHCFVTNNLNQRDKGCDCTDKKGCTQDGHDAGDHCAHHCMFDRYKEDSDRFHSFLTTLAAIRMPQKISEYVGSKQREEETRTRRSISAHDYANHLNDFVNTLKTTQHRTEVAVKVMKRRDDSKPEAVLYQSDRDASTIKEKRCIICKENKHWANQCPKGKAMGPDELADKVKGSKACFICLVVGHTQEKCRNKEKLKCARCVKRGMNANHSYLLCKHRMVERQEKEPSLIAAENDAVDPPAEEETELSSS